MSSNIPRNILFIGLDQFRWDTSGPWNDGRCRTPAMDSLFDSGVSFSRAYTPCALCSPARASMLTGRYAFSHGMGTNCDMYHSLARELPEPGQFLMPAFQDAGYKTSWFGKWHVGTESGPADHGWDGISLPGYGNVRESDGFRGYLQEKGLSYQPVPEVWMNPNEQTLAAGQWGGPVESTPAHYLVDSTISQMEADVAAGDRFLTSTQFWGPHGPHMPSNEFYGMHDPESIEPWPHWDQDISTLPRRIGRERDDFYRGRPKSWDEQRILVARYFDCCAMIDYEIGRILHWLEENRLRDETVVVLTSDHGDMNGSHGGLADKGFLYEDVLRVPLTFSCPSAFEPARRDDLASNMDIMPTLMDICGLDVPDGLDGRSLLGALSGDPTRSRRDAFLAEFHGLRFLYSQRALLSDDGWKYIFTPGDNDEVYNLKEDSWEMNNVVNNPAANATIAGLRDRLEKEVHAAGDPLRDCVSKFFGNWYTGSGQIDASKFFDSEPRT